MDRLPAWIRTPLLIAIGVVLLLEWLWEEVTLPIRWRWWTRKRKRPITRVDSPWER